MTCSKCGASSATVHITQIIGGVRTVHDYCENCAPADVKQTMQEFKSGTFDPEAQWQAKWEKLHAEHPEFSTEAYSFVQKAMFHHHLEIKAQPQQGSLKLSELLKSCQAYAKDLYGESAKTLLKSWGIETFLDVGEIFIFINSEGLNGRLDSARENRRQEMYEKMRESLRQKYGQLPFLSNES